MGHDAENIFRWAPTWLVCALLLVSLVLASEVGYRFGIRRRGDLARAEDTAGLQVILGALLGLLSLLLAFTYSYVVIRAEARKDAVIDEANAIGTAYLRASLVPAPIGPELQSVLREYLDTRIVSDELAEDPKRLQQAIQRSEEVQARIWPLVERIVAGRTPTPIDGTLVLSINEVIDLHTVRLAAARDHVPAVVMWMLFVLAVAAMDLCGYVSGSSGARHIGRNSIFAVMVVVVTFIILDLDRGSTGLIRVSQQSLEDVQRHLRAAELE
jgi:uncharacterized protein YqgC (DUF456 family)